MDHKNTIAIRINVTDKERLISEFRTQYLKLHPELDGMRLPIRFLIKKLLDFGLDEGEFT